MFKINLVTRIVLVFKVELHSQILSSFYLALLLCLLKFRSSFESLSNFRNRDDEQIFFLVI